MSELTLKETSAIVHLALRRLGESIVLDEERMFWESYFNNTLGDLRVAINNEIKTLFQGYKIENEKNAEVLDARFFEGHSIVKTALNHNLSRDQVNRRQKAGLQSLAELLLEKHNQIRKKQISLLLSRLKPSQTVELFGLADQERQLQEYLISPNAHHVITITGIGGIGKTALMNHGIRRIIPEMIYRHILWIHGPDAKELISRLSVYFRIEWTDKSDQLTKVIQTLKENPTLIVIDGVETEIQLAAFMSQLAPLSNPTKFILASRVQPDRSSVTTNIKLTELSKTSSFDLIEDYIQASALDEHLQGVHEKFDDIYSIIGGNPLALRIFAGLLEIFSSSVLLDDFEKADIKTIEDLYVKLLLKSWQSLRPGSQKLLEEMSLVDEEKGADLTRLLNNIELGEKEMLNAIQQLAVRSLLEKRLDDAGTRYGIHRLTKSFLLTEIIKWQGEEILP